MKDIYELLSDVDINLGEFEEIMVTDIERERVKKAVSKKVKVSKISYKRGLVSAATIALVAIGSIVVVKPAFAYEIPIIGDLMQSKYLSINKSYENYINIIGKTKSNEGIDVTFEQVFVDNNVMLLQFVVKNNNEEIENNYTDAMLIPTSMSVNGKAVSTGAGGRREIIDKNTIRVLKNIDISGDKLPNKMNVKIDIDNLYGKKADWGVEFSIDKSDIVNQTKIIKENKTIQSDDIKGVIKDITISPLTVSIKGELNIDGGSDIRFGYILEDNNGKLLVDEGASISKNKGNLYETSNNFISNSGMTSIKVTPVYYNNDSMGSKIKLQSIPVDVSGKPFSIEDGNGSEVKIYNAVLDGEYLIIKSDILYKGKKESILTRGMGQYVTIDGKEAEVFKSEPQYIETRTEEKTLFGTSSKVEYTLDESKYDPIYKGLLDKYKDGEGNLTIYKVGNSQDIKIGMYKYEKFKVLSDQSFTIDLNN